MAGHNTVVKKTSAPGVPQNFGTLIAKISNLFKTNNPIHERYNIDSLVKTSLMICGLVHTQKECIRESFCERREKQESKGELVWEWQSTQRPGSSRSNPVSTSSALSSWLKGVTHRSPSWSRILLSYCQPGIKTTAKLSPHIPNRLPSSWGKMLALSRTTFFASLVHCLASQGSISTHLCYMNRETSFLQLAGLTCSLWVMWV